MALSLGGLGSLQDVGHHSANRFGVTSDKNLVGPGPVQSTTTVDTQPTTTFSSALPATFTEWTHGSFVGRFGNPLQDVGHHSEQCCRDNEVCTPFFLAHAEVDELYTGAYR